MGEKANIIEKINFNSPKQNNLMENNVEYPRVLIIYTSCINNEDQHGVSIRGWFADWPKDKLAQIYSGGEVGDKRFCGYTFKLGQNERKFGKLFIKLRGSSLGQSSYSISLDENNSKLTKLSAWALLKNRIGEYLINTGLWEIIFRPALSREMCKFVTDFNPQLIYCQGYLLTFTWLPLMLHKKFNIPICFQTGDDWPSSLYRNSPLSFTIKPIVDRTVKKLLLKSSVRLTNGTLMTKEYKERYGLSFEPIMMCDNLIRFREASPLRVVDDSTISIIYSGNLTHGRWDSIIDLCEAAQRLQIKEGFKIMITAFATSIPPKAINKLHEIDNLQILPGPSHEDLPTYLKGADILFLPETLDSNMASDIHLSLSTKAHFYMMSEKPILVYGSPITGIVNYAQEEKWACVIQERDLDKLTQALRVLIIDKVFCEQLIITGIEVVKKYHIEENVKKRFLSILNKVALTH